MRRDIRFNIECDETDRLQREAEIEMPRGYIERSPVPREWPWPEKTGVDGYVFHRHRGVAKPRTDEQKKAHYRFAFKRRSPISA